MWSAARKGWSWLHPHHHWWQWHLLPGLRGNQHLVPQTCQAAYQQRAFLPRRKFQLHRPQQFLPCLMPDPEYVRIKIADIPSEFIEEYKLKGCNCDGWIYFKICQGCYGLPQSSILANNLLWSHLLAEGYYKAESTPGLWRHKWRPIQFCLIDDDFGVKYVGLKLINHLRNVLKKFHRVQFNMAGNKFVGIDIKWDCATCQCCISMPGYTNKLLIKLKHPRPTKSHLLPHKCLPIAYSAKAQPAPPANTSEQLDLHQKGCIQEIVGLLLYYAQAVNNKLFGSPQHYCHPAIMCYRRHQTSSSPPTRLCCYLSFWWHHLSI